MAAEPDSLAMAFFYLEHDLKVEKADGLAKVARDSVKFVNMNDWWKNTLDEERSRRHRDLVIICIASAVGGTLVYLGTRMAD